jgi:hypothetical protein
VRRPAPCRRCCPANRLLIAFCRFLIAAVSSLSAAASSSVISSCHLPFFFPFRLLPLPYIILPPPLRLPIRRHCSRDDDKHVRDAAGERLRRWYRCRSIYPVEGEEEELAPDAYITQNVLPEMRRVRDGDTNSDSMV